MTNVSILQPRTTERFRFNIQWTLRSEHQGGKIILFLGQRQRSKDVSDDTNNDITSVIIWELHSH